LQALLGANEKADAKLFLQSANLVAECRSGNKKLLGCIAQIGVTPGDGKGAQGVE
jgi:hypothetical protein